MKICLISPQGLRTTNKKITKIFEETGNMLGYFHSLTGAFSSGLLVIAALTPEDTEIKIIDRNYDAIDYNENYDLVGISAMTQQATEAYEIADEFKKRGVTVVMGGIHATVMPEEAKAHCDSVFVGEAEHTWPVFIKDFKQNKISRFYENKRPVDLTRIPIPRYDLLKKENYKVIWMQTSRGCPRDCEFCAASKVYGHKFRHKSIKQILDEVRIIKNIWPDARIDFSDDNFFVDRKFSERIIKEFKKLDFKWFAQTDVSIAKDEAFLESLRDAGCTTLFIGFESISKDSLKQIDKNDWKLNQLPSYQQTIKIIQSKGIGVVGAFMIGLDGDNVETIDELIDFIIDNNIFFPQITISTPLPGTRLYERLKMENRILNKPWRDYTFLEVTFMPKKMTIEDLQNGIYKMYERIYTKEVRLKVLKHFKTIFQNHE